MFFFALQLAIVSNSVPPAFYSHSKLVARVGISWIWSCVQNPQTVFHSWISSWYQHLAEHYYTDASQSHIYTAYAFSSWSFMFRCLRKSYLHSICLLKPNICAQMPPKVVFTQHMPSQAEHYCIDASQSRIYSVYAFPSRCFSFAVSLPKRRNILVVPPTLYNRCCLVCLLRCECNAVELLR